MILAKCLIAMVAAVCLGAPVFGKSIKPAAALGKGCFEQNLTPVGSGVRRIVVDLSEPKVHIEYNGGRNVPFLVDGCDFKSGTKTIRCEAVCDGGRANFTLIAGKLVVEAENIRTLGELDTAIPMIEDADGGQLVGRFELNPVPPQICENSFNNSENLSSLQRGDFSPRVKAVKKNLADLGYLLQRPDWYFDAPTVAAIRAFQLSAGFPVTGVADAKTIEKLNLVAGLSGGC